MTRIPIVNDIHNQIHSDWSGMFFVFRNFTAKRTGPLFFSAQRISPFSAHSLIITHVCRKAALVWKGLKACQNRLPDTTESRKPQLTDDVITVFLWSGAAQRAANQGVDLTSCGADQFTLCIVWKQECTGSALVAPSRKADRVLRALAKSVSSIPDV